MLVSLLVWAVPAAAQLDEDDTSDHGARWIPALTIHTGVLGLQSKGSVSSDDRGDFDERKRPVYPFVTGGLQLASPQLEMLPGKPRVFVHGAAEFVFDLDRSIVNEGDPGEVIVTPFDPDMDGQDVLYPPEGLVIGTGSATRAKVEQLAFVAGAGVSFALPLGERQLRVKPSFEYRYDEYEVETILSDARSLAGDGVCPCRTVELSAADTEGFHSIGPGLELELDAARTDAFLITLFASAQGYRVLGGRRVNVQASGMFDPGGEPARVDSSFERDPWSVRGGVGVRVHWLPR